MRNRLLYGLMCFVAAVGFAGAYVHADDTVPISKESGEAYNDGRKLFDEGKFSEAAVLFRNAVELDERNTAALFAQGLALYRMKKYEDAVRVLNRLLDREPGHEKALRLLPTVLATLGQQDEALHAYDHGISRFPDNYWFYYGKAKVYIGLGNNSEAAKALEQAVERAPGLIELYETLASVYAAQGKMEKAFGTAQTILGKNPRNPRALVISADYKRMTGRLEEALEDYRIAAESIETRAYAEHYIMEIRRTLEEREIEKEFEERTGQNN